MPEQSHAVEAAAWLAEVGQQVAEAAQRFSEGQQDAAHHAQHLAEQAQRVAEYRQRLAEAALEVAEAARQDAEDKRGRLAEFLAIATHELKTPLTSLRGYRPMLTALLVDEPLTPASQYARKARRHAEPLIRLMNNPLDLSCVGWTT